MRIMAKFSLLLGLAALLAGPAVAQFRGGNVGGRFSGIPLLNKGVQEELKLSPEQVSKLTRVADAVRAKHSAASAKLSKEHQEYLGRSQQLTRTLNAAMDKASAVILKPEQARRLKQIELQTRSLAAFGDPQVQKALQLTDKQQQTLRAIQTELGSARGRGNRTPSAQRQQQLKAGMDKFLALLSADQQKAWQELAGPPFAGLAQVASLTSARARRTNPTSLVLNPSVQADLKLSPEQVGKLTRIPAEVRARHREESAGLTEQVRQYLATSIALNNTITAETRQALARVTADILKPEQLQHLKQIEATVQAARDRRGSLEGGWSGVGRFISAIPLLDRSVQNELKLSLEQVSKLTRVADAVRAKHKDASAKLSKEYQEYLGKNQQLTRTLNAAMDKAIAAILKPEQARRLKQIELQTRWLAAFTDSQVQKALQLTDKQQQDLRAIQAELGSARGRGNRTTVAQRQQQLKAGMDRFLALLSADQQKAWQELAGPPFAGLAQVASLTSARARRTNPTSLVLNPSVQADLKLSTEQVGKLSRVPAEVRARHREESARLSELFGQYRAKSTALNNTITAETRQALARVTADILKPEQLQHLKQIEAAIQARTWDGRGRRGDGWDGIGPFTSAIPLLNRSMQNELKLSPEQVSKLTRVADAVRAKHSAASARLSKEYQEYRGKRQELTRTLNAAMDKASAVILKPEQARRLKQIELQARWLAAFADPQVQKALQMTDRQQQDLRAIQAELRLARGRGNRTPAAQRQQQLKAGMDRFLALLSADQQKAWQELAGPPFAGLAQVASLTSARARRNNPTSLVLNPSVQADLKLSAEQVGKLTRVPAEVRARRQEESARLSQQLQQYWAKSTALTNTITAETRQALARVTADILKPEQLQRLKQIEIQQLGVEAFSNAEVQKALQLTEEQKKDIKAIGATLSKEIARARQDAGRDFQKTRALATQTATWNKEALARMVARLTADQKKTWQELTGAPFASQPRGPRFVPPQPRKGEAKK